MNKELFKIFYKKDFKFEMCQIDTEIKLCFKRQQGSIWGTTVTQLTIIYILLN